MEFYKKNPVYPGTIFVQGEPVDDDAVVAGDEFKPFSDPNTFPGREPKLIKVDLQDLSPKQKEGVQRLLGKKLQSPPRHLGVIKSSQFSTTGEGDVKVHHEPKLPEPVAAKAPAKASLLDEDSSEEGDGLDVTSGTLPIIPGDRPVSQKSLREVYDEAALSEVFPGITTKNATSILGAFETLTDLSNASNSALKKAGVQGNYFRRVRTKAKELAESGE